MIFRVRYHQAGAHMRCWFFAGPHEGALGNCGDLTMRVEEFKEFYWLTCGDINFQHQERSEWQRQQRKR